MPINVVSFDDVADQFFFRWIFWQFEWILEDLKYIVHYLDFLGVLLEDFECSMVKILSVVNCKFCVIKEKEED